MEKKKLKLGIIGHGFVGKATDYGFNKNIKKFIVDPIYDYSIDDLAAENPEVVFICVPTPMKDDGNQDATIIENVVKQTTELLPDTLIIIKSTVLPSVLKKLCCYSKNLVYNPEFLREKHAKEDFINSSMVIFGGEKNLCKKASKIYKNNSRCKSQEHIFLDMESASFVKYSINTFLATKVIFFNELYRVFANLKSNDDWEKIIETIALDERIGNSHMNVPGHDGRYGFGGACFPKDSAAFSSYSGNNDELSLLKTAIKKNNKIRGAYKELDVREKEQNVKYNN